MPLRSWNTVPVWANLIANVDVGTAGAFLRQTIRQYSVANSNAYPYVTDFFQESKPFMRALHGQGGFFAKAWGVSRAIAWDQGPVEFLWGNTNQHLGFTIVNVQVVRNTTLYRNYSVRKVGMLARIRTRFPGGVAAVPIEAHPQRRVLLEPFPVADATVKECYLFSGHTLATLNNIIRTGARPDLGAYDPGFFGIVGGKGHGALGRGAYLTDQIDKAITYSPCTGCNSTGSCDANCLSPPRRLLLSRVLLGSSYQTANAAALRHAHLNALVKPDLWNAGINMIRAQGVAGGLPAPPLVDTHYDSVIGLASKQQGHGVVAATLSSYLDSNEYLVRNADQIYPEYVIHYTVP